MGPLDELRVIEFAHIMAGPVCGLMLADMGADVIKVEKPDGDDSRRFVPPAIDGESAAYMMLNRNKRGLAIDLKKESGRKIANRLCTSADVLIENFSRGAMDRLGLGYESMSRLNPGLIYCELSGFGRTGPYADRGGFDLIAQAASGLMSITGEGPERPPTKCGAPLTDITAGILAAMGILAALFNRQKTGQGQRVDTSLFEAGIIHTYWQSAATIATGQPPTAMGSAHPLSAPYQAFETADGWITVGAATQPKWLRLLQAVEKQELQSDERFTDNASRIRHLDDLVAVLRPVFKSRSSEAWLKRLEAARVPVGPILDIAEMQRHEQTLARQMVTPITSASGAETKTLGHPVKFSKTPVAIERGAPVLGEHTYEVLLEHGYTEDEIAQFVQENVLFAPRSPST
jgi:crotonobetainyl-CoA:carnitine CoA-transferase CaiB-like acyl-CoA transferase